MEKNAKTEIIIIYEIKQVDLIITCFDIEKIKSENGHVIVPTSYEIELVLRDKNIPFYSMVGYSARSSGKERAVLVSSIVKQLYTDPELNFFEHNGIKLGRVVGYSLGEYLLRILYYLDIFEFILNQFKEVDTIYLPEPMVELSSTVGQLAEFEIRAGVDVMTFLARKRGLSLKFISYSLYFVTEKKVHNFVRSLTRSFFIWLVRFLNGVILLFRANDAIKIFVSDYWWHVDSFITKMKRVEITIMERKEIQNAKIFSWKYKMRFNHPSDYTTHFIKAWAEKKRQYYEKKWQELGRRSNFSKQFVWYGINFWEIVSPAYKHLVTVFSEKMVETIESTEQLFKKQKINIVILRASLSGQIHFSILGLVAHRMGIPAIELQHGLECSESFSLSIHKCADILASYGPFIKKELEKVNKADSQVINIGSPRFDQYRNEIIGLESKDTLRKKLNIDVSRPVLLYIATDIVLGQTHDTYSMLRLFKNISSATSQIEELQVIVKIRPGPATENFFRRSLKEVFGEKCCIAQYENIHELIAISSVVASSFSTVTLEAMIAGSPLILVGIDKNDLMLIESHFLPYEKAEALRVARTEEDITYYVRVLISNPNESKILVSKANNFLKENFCFDGGSAERMATFLETLRKQKD